MKTWTMTITLNNISTMGKMEMTETEMKEVVVTTRVLAGKSRLVWVVSLAIRSN